MTRAQFINKVFKNKNGEIILWETPNWALIGWAFFKVIANLHVRASIKSGLEFIAAALLFMWAMQEIFQGTNYFRRLLGCVVLLILLMGQFK